MDSDRQPAIIHLAHLPAKVPSMIGATFQDIELPLMDHLVCQGVDQLVMRLLFQQWHRQSNLTAVGREDGAIRPRSPRADGADEHPGRCGEPATPHDLDGWQPSMEMLDIQILPEGLKLVATQDSGLGFSRMEKIAV
jgi:hypothetical protein